MYRAMGVNKATDEYSDMSFRSQEVWPRLSLFGQSAPLAATLLGDAECGPALFFTATPPGTAVDPPKGSSHSHASDHWRVPVLGETTVGREIFGPGEFFFQRGWIPYPIHNNAQGPDGGWEILLLADRRGCAARLVSNGNTAQDRQMASMMRTAEAVIGAAFGISGDTFSDDPADAPGPSAVVTTLGAMTSGRLRGSFQDSAAWPSVSAHSRAVVALMGDSAAGPIVILSITEPGGEAATRCQFETEVFRAVVAGSCKIDGTTYRAGDMRVQRASAWCDQVVAGDDGLCEVVILGDRRKVVPGVDRKHWPHGIDDITSELLSSLEAAAR